MSRRGGRRVVAAEPGGFRSAVVGGKGSARVAGRRAASRGTPPFDLDQSTQPPSERRTSVPAASRHTKSEGDAPLLLFQYSSPPYSTRSSTTAG